MSGIISPASGRIVASSGLDSWAALDPGLWRSIPVDDVWQVPDVDDADDLVLFLVGDVPVAVWGEEHVARTYEALAGYEIPRSGNSH